MGLKSFNPYTASRRFITVARQEPYHQANAGKIPARAEKAHWRPQQSRRNRGVASRWRPQEAISLGRFPARQSWRVRPRWRPSNTIPNRSSQPRAVALCRRREALHSPPRGLWKSARRFRPAKAPTSFRAMRCSSGTFLQARMVHNLELYPGRGGQVVRSAGGCGAVAQQRRRPRSGEVALRRSSKVFRGLHGHGRPGWQSRSRKRNVSAKLAARAGAASSRRCAAWL